MIITMDALGLHAFCLSIFTGIKIPWQDYSLLSFLKLEGKIPSPPPPPLLLPFLFREIGNSWHFQKKLYQVQLDVFLPGEI